MSEQAPTLTRRTTIAALSACVTSAIHLSTIIYSAPEDKRTAANLTPMIVVGVAIISVLALCAFGAIRRHAASLVAFAAGIYAALWFIGTSVAVAVGFTGSKVVLLTAVLAIAANTAACLAAALAGAGRRCR